MLFGEKVKNKKGQLGLTLSLPRLQRRQRSGAQLPWVKPQLCVQNQSRIGTTAPTRLWVSAGRTCVYVAQPAGFTCPPACSRWTCQLGRTHPIGHHALVTHTVLSGGPAGTQRAGPHTHGATARWLNGGAWLEVRIFFLWTLRLCSAGIDAPSYYSLFWGGASPAAGVISWAWMEPTPQQGPEPLQ